MRAGGPVVIHVDFSPAESDQIYFPQIEVIGEIADSMCRLGHELGGRHAKDRLMVPVRDLVLERTSDGNDDPRYPLAPQRLVADVRKVMPKDGILCLDNGMYKIWFARNYRTDMSNTLLLDNALATMGAGLPSAMMAAMLYPSHRGMAVCGDGGFIMNSQDIETAVCLGAQFSSAGYRRQCLWHDPMEAGSRRFPGFRFDLHNPDFVQYAHAYGATAVRIASADELIPALEKAFKTGGVHLVVAAIDYSENHRVLVDELNSRKTTTGNIVV